MLFTLMAGHLLIPVLGLLFLANRKERQKNERLLKAAIKTKMYKGRR